jgi:hypothetical protein
MTMSDLKDFLKEMGLDKVKADKVTYTLPKREVEYVYNDPRDPITGEVPF